MTNPTPIDEYTLEALEGASRVSARTIRYYISQGLIPPPSTMGRHATYGEVHLATLRRISALKAQGATLEAIAAELHPQTAESALSKLQPWGVLQPTDDVAIFIRTDLPHRRRTQIDKALVPFVTAIARTRSEEG